MAAPLPNAAELALADYQTIETSMIETTQLRQQRRLGFDAEDYAYAPRAAPIRVMWLAVHRTTRTACPTWTMTCCAKSWASRPWPPSPSGCAADLDPADYYFMPSHPWQWFNKLSLAFAPMSPTARSCAWAKARTSTLARQSIRTFNISQPAKRYVKTSLSILNMRAACRRTTCPARRSTSTSTA